MDRELDSTIGFHAIIGVCFTQVAMLALGSKPPQVNPFTVDGKIYNVVPGYGEERADYIRGKKNNNDQYIVTTLKLTYIFGKTFNRAKFR